MNIEHTCFGFIGLGLIGSSIAKTIRRLSPTSRIIAYNRTFSVAELALKDGVADIICPQVDETFAQCDYIFLCTPVKYNVTYLKMLAPIIKESCILTDVGSVKANIHQHVTEFGLEKQFIGGHPMAGSDRTGYENATDQLLTNARYIITPTSQSSPEQIQNYQELVRMLGAVPIVMNYEEHDYAVAAISHVPHVISASLVELIRRINTPESMLQDIAAGGFKDTTRIAGSSPTMWQQICMTNRDNICQLLDDYIEILTNTKTSIQNNCTDEIYEFLANVSTYRNHMFEPK